MKEGFVSKMWSFIHTNRLAKTVVAGLKVCTFALVALVLIYSYTASLKVNYMDPAAREAFLATVEAEEDWLEGVSRRLSSGGVAAPPDSNPSPGGGPTRRSGRKRKSTTEATDLRRLRMASSTSNASAPGQETSVLDQLKELMKQMKEVRDDVNRSETSTSGKIDTLSKKMADRLGNTEQSVKCLSKDVATVKADLAKVKRKASEDTLKLERLVERVVEKKLEANTNTSTPVHARRPRVGERLLTGANLQPVEHNRGKEETYLKARRSLKMWPVTGDNLEEATVEFLEGKLCARVGRFSTNDIKVSELYTGPDSVVRNQVLVEFSSTRLRDEAKTLARNLRGESREVGVQIEVPDHLRGRFQTFQSLAFELKKKNPALRRNIKFMDQTMDLVMDVKLGPDAEWKAVQYEDASAIMPTTRSRTASISRRELAGLVSKDESNESDSDMDTTIVDLTSADPNKKHKDYTASTLTFINTNARSLGPKIESLFDCFHEKDVDVALLTETWYQTNRMSTEELADYADRFSLGVIARNRDAVAANGRQYGGVALFYRQRTSSFANFEIINQDGHEVLAAVGSVKGIKGKVFCIVAYAPPSLTLLRARQLNNYLSDLIGEAKRKYPDCTLIVGGDFNHWPAEEAIEDHVEITEVLHGNTRGSRAIDRSFVNFGEAITEAGTLPPLENEQGGLSDHRIGFAVATFVKPKTPTITYTYRRFTEQGAVKFGQMLAAQSWVTVFAAVGATAKVEMFQSLLELLMSKCFATVTTTRRKADPPWVNDKIRRLSKKRRKVYDKEGRSERWKSLKKACQDLYKKRAAVYMEEQKRTLTEPDASRSFFKNVKAYQSREKPPQFDVHDLFPDQSDAGIADTLANHFNAISAEFDGLEQDQIPQAEPGWLPYLSNTDVVNRLRKFRKPKSKVKGDIFPALINRVAPALSVPLTHIYNSITITHEWPDPWKIEYVTPIPKKATPTSADDLRNISCTQLFSKIYESFILEWVTSQVKLRNNQYGGVKGRGAEHFLVALWQRVLENIEDSRAGSLLTSIDYSKAFNRLDFKHCLNCLHTKGANGKLIRIISSFLTGRSMRVKVGDTLSDPRPVLGGVPQGSLLGVFLFDLSIDDFEAFSPDVPNYSPPDHALTAPAAGGLPDELVVPEPTARDRRHTFPFATVLMQVLKYVDDNILNEKINFDTVLTDLHSFRIKLAVRTQNLFRRIVHQAEAVGMKVNSLKTLTMCIAELKSYIPQAFFFDKNGCKISTVNSMKVLGVHFTSDPDMTAQVESIKRKFRARIWVLNHLGHRGFSREDLLKVYKSTILPIHDYCSCVFNSSLTLSQSSALERLQARALKAIYGYEHSYRSLLEHTGLTTLQERRDRRCKKFAEKCLQDDHFRTWFPLNPVSRSTRKPLPYLEVRTRTKRLENSPVYHMRRLLNGKAA